jgi:DnaK suppressor protein
MGMDNAHFRNLIERRLRELIDALEQRRSGDDNGTALDQTRVGRLSRRDALQQQAMAIGVRETLLREQRRLEAALLRLDEATFGICCQCGDAIAEDRLEADPGVPFCAPCQEQVETRRARSGRCARRTARLTPKRACACRRRRSRAARSRR